MQLVSNGPDIPDELLQAHEEGRVVLFCGAGISYPAGLPDFKGLVDEIYRLVGTRPNDIEQETYDHRQFDATLDLLERRLPGQRLAVRTAVLNALQPKLRRKGATDTHTALLQLACSRDRTLRLVTTNYDHIFERAAKRSKLLLNTYMAPMVPVPKKSRWNGLVYLHGVLPLHPDASALNRLVITSGDFGLAYLTERWAARFVSELFRNYVVCFVGYSINDPVLRYMMDALAADRMLGEVMPQAYGIGACIPGQEKKSTIEWEAKGVIPVLYEVSPDNHNHSALHRTLKAWAETYRNGILGKERIVVDYAMARPSASTRQDDFVGRMLWALSHESGLPAKRFADFDPVPSLDWLTAFSENRYHQCDLMRFQVPPQPLVDTKLAFSLVNRPTPYTRASWQSLVSNGIVVNQWDDVMFHLARWLVRHLDDPALILWLAQGGGQLHDRLKALIEARLDYLATLQREGKSEELACIRAQAPNAIPRPLLRPVWRMLLTGRVKSQWRDLDLYHWKDRLRREGLTATLRFELRELLAPKVTLHKPIAWRSAESAYKVPERLMHLVNWELVLATSHVHAFLRTVDNSGPWQGAMPTLLADFEQLLRDALDLLRELGEIYDRSDRSHWVLPSISQHWQNRGFHDWVALIELVRDAWLVVRQHDPPGATKNAQAWFALPYPTFKRLALFAASHDHCIVPDQWVDWLVADDAWWLWSADTGRETMRLLVLQGSQLTPRAQTLLEQSILSGPPPAMYPDDLGTEEWQHIVDRSVWLRLSKLQSSGVRLASSTAERLTALSVAHPEWRIADNERDEFSCWMSGTGDPDFQENRKVDLAPRKRVELVAWLRQPLPPHSLFYEDTWRETCRTRFFHAALALSDLVREREYPSDRWREAIQVWAEDGRVQRSWRIVAPLILGMPDTVLKDVAHSVAWWMEAVSKTPVSHPSMFLALCRRILDLPCQDTISTAQPVTQALNHSVGLITQALLNLWFEFKPNDNEGLPDDMKPIFTALCDTSVSHFRHGRVLLASRLIALFRVDQRWTETCLLPLFDWNTNAVESSAAWQGFLWSPRLYRPLLVAVKRQFLDAARHYVDLGEHARQFAAFLTFVALDEVDTYTPHDFQTTLSALPQDGLHEAAKALVHALEGTAEQREDYWINRIQPFWFTIWPKSRQLASPNIADSLARLTLAARRQFPQALSAVYAWLQPLEFPHSIVHELCKSNLAPQFPEDALRLLDAIIDNQLWVPPELPHCLNAISQAAPALSHDARYIRLEEFCRRRGNLP